MPNASKRNSSTKPAARRHASGASSKRGSSGSKTARSRSTPEIAAKNATAEDMKFIRRYANSLSKTTQRAKWLHSPEEHEDRPGQSLATRSHEVIQHWAEERGARPATVEGTRHDGRPGVLRFDFPGYGGGGRLKEIGWDEWFSSFDDRSLVFLFQEHKRDGNQSNFFRLDNPKREHA